MTNETPENCACTIERICSPCTVAYIFTGRARCARCREWFDRDALTVRPERRAVLQERVCDGCYADLYDDATEQFDVD